MWNVFWCIVASGNGRTRIITKGEIEGEKLDETYSAAAKRAESRFVCLPSDPELADCTFVVSFIVSFSPVPVGLLDIIPEDNEEVWPKDRWTLRRHP
jgi:hypothetical protein